MKAKIKKYSSKIKLVKKQEEAASMKKPLVSVIIPTYNSEKTLAKCLKSIKNQSYRNIEVIVVDRFSKDRTVEIAKSYKAKVYQLDYERVKAKNSGLMKAKPNAILKK